MSFTCLIIRVSISVDAEAQAACKTNVHCPTFSLPFNHSISLPAKAHQRQRNILTSHASLKT